MNIGMVIAHQRFRDEEYFVPAKTFRDRGLQVTTISSHRGQAVGKLGGIASVDQLIQDVDVVSFDALLFIGGPGAREYVESPVAHRIAQDAYKQGKLVGAICMAPLILAHAGLLKGKRSTVFHADKEELIQHGALYTGNDVELDSGIVTACGPEAALAFAQKVLEILKIQ